MANGSGTKSTQKLPKHHSYASQTQDSYDYPGGKAYDSGNDAGKGKSRGGRDPDGAAPAAGPRKYTSNN